MSEQDEAADVAEDTAPAVPQLSDDQVVNVVRNALAGAVVKPGRVIAIEIHDGEDQVFSIVALGPDVESEEAADDEPTDEAGDDGLSAGGDDNE